MQKMTKVFGFAVAVAMAGGAFAAGLADKTIMFSAKPSQYADGTLVKKGEWCAVCWSPRATFGGIDDAFAPRVEGDKVIRVRNTYVNDDGSCGPVLVWLDESEIAGLANGNFFIFIVDTRGADGQVAAADPVTGKPVTVNGIAPATEVAITASAAYASATDQTVPENGYDVVFEAGKEPTPARITQIIPADDVVDLVVSGMSPSIRYTIQSGKTLESVEEFKIGGQPGLFDGSDVTFSVPKDQANFFKVARDPAK